MKKFDTFNGLELTGKIYMFIKSATMRKSDTPNKLELMVNV